MKISLLANFNNQNNNKIEETISYVLDDMGHEVVELNESTTSLDEVIESANDSDLFLFFKGGVPKIHSLEDFTDALYKIKTTKVCWYFDKVWGDRVNFIHKISPLTNFVFLTDGTFVRRHNYINHYELKEATDVLEKREGKFKPEYAIPIVFPGTVYGQRQKWANALKNHFGNAFQIVNGVYDEELESLCESAKIIVAPRFPQDNFYWSNRVYQIVGRAGFMLHPYLEKLTEEFEDGEHLVFYRDMEDLVEKIYEYIDNNEERDRIRLKGRDYCLENHTYYQAFKEMFNIINNA